MSYLVPPAGPDHPGEIAKRLIEECDEFSHLRAGEPRIEWLFRLDAVVEKGRQVMGTMFLPEVQGKLRPLFDWLLGRFFPGDEELEFLCVLDRDFWEASDARTREVLVFHELMHCGHALNEFGVPRYDKFTGRPVFCIRGHDIEEFVAVVERYGAWHPGLEEFIEAATSAKKT